ncbi:unnamed protein product [Paramecium pentaurelia]|uniref:non-specific serine/threonine protein kinase n=1 Tax=Paramecium pentaurelia TaxID=43138 RepID=A0A8S1WWB0_9CILI|nr:unnamed protein product [Paramecium pentaurelia]
MENFFDKQAYQIETGIPIFKQIVLLKIQSNDVVRCHLKLENTQISLYDYCKEELILNTINIANSYLEFTLHVCMGRGVYIKQSSKQLQIFGLTPQLIQILKLYGIQKDFATQYTVIKEIGRGSFGKVYQVKNVQNNQLYAVKMFEKQLLLDTKYRQAIRKEIQILRLMDHPNVLSIVECFESEQCIFLVEELLDSHLQIGVDCILKEEKAILILIKVLKGLEYIHSKNILHRDIKPNNILLRSNGEPVISDFGFADFYRLDGNYLFLKCGTNGYLAPEMITTQNYNYKVDIYSLGVVFRQLLTGCASNLFDISTLSNDCQKLIQGMLCSNPNNRLSINEIRQNNLIRRILRRSQILKAMSNISEKAKCCFINDQKNDVETKSFSIYQSQIPSLKSL